jgi:ribose-phosphate pyrophosphokinase
MTEKQDNPGSAPRLILSLPGNEAFGQHLAAAGHWELGPIETRQFPDGESYVRILSDVSGQAVDLVCTLARPDDGFLRLIFAADAARALGAREVTLIAPYLAYMRQDRRFQSGEAVTSKSFARLVSSSFDRLVTVDPHLHRYSTLSALYTIPTDTMHAAPLLADWIAAEVNNPLLVGPDEESGQWVSAIAARIGAPHAVLRKIRHGDRNVDVELPDRLVRPHADRSRSQTSASRLCATRGGRCAWHFCRRFFPAPCAALQPDRFDRFCSS